MKGDPLLDPKGLMTEAFRMEGISKPECRSIFLDWALSLPEGADPREAIAHHLEQLGGGQSGHPMAEVLREGLQQAQKGGRRGGRRGRVPS